MYLSAFKWRYLVLVNMLEGSTLALIVFGRWIQILLSAKRVKSKNKNHVLKAWFFVPFSQEVQFDATKIFGYYPNI